MPVDREILLDTLDLQLGIGTLADAAGFERVATTPVGTRTPKRIGEMLFLTTTSQFFIATGTSNTSWQPMTAAS